VTHGGQTDEDGYRASEAEAPWLGVQYGGKSMPLARWRLCFANDDLLIFFIYVCLCMLEKSTPTLKENEKKLIH
jgi:hypothetical protein